MYAQYASVEEKAVPESSERKTSWRERRQAKRREQALRTGDSPREEGRAREAWGASERFG